MSLSMVKMWVSIIGMGFMLAAMAAIFASRYKLKSALLRGVTAVFAYACLILGGLIMTYIVLSGPAD